MIEDAIKPVLKVSTLILHYPTSISAFVEERRKLTWHNNICPFFDTEMRIHLAHNIFICDSSAKRPNKNEDLGLMMMMR
jgi:hypothetical protein